MKSCSFLRKNNTFKAEGNDGEAEIVEIYVLPQQAWKKNSVPPVCFPIGLVTNKLKYNSLYRKVVSILP